MTRQYNINGTMLKIKKGWFRKRVVVKMFEQGNMCPEKYSFSFSDVNTIINAYYSFLLSNSQFHRYTQIAVKKGREITFYNSRHEKGIRIGCMWFTDSQVQMIHNEIL